MPAIRHNPRHCACRGRAADHSANIGSRDAVRCAPFHVYPPPAPHSQLKLGAVPVTRLKFHDAVEPYCEHSSGRDMPARFANTCWNMHAVAAAIMDCVAKRWSSGIGQTDSRRALRGGLPIVRPGRFYVYRGGFGVVVLHLR